MFGHPCNLDLRSIQSQMLRSVCKVKIYDILDHLACIETLKPTLKIRYLNALLVLFDYPTPNTPGQPKAKTEEPKQVQNFNTEEPELDLSV